MTVGKEGAPAVALAHRGDFTLANATIRPSTRTVEGPGGSLTVEPKIMQVLLVLADADRSVITREDLIRACWGGRIVGDDAVNRTIAELRRVARQTGADFSIETIPRIGYRLDRGVGGDAPRHDAAKPTRRLFAASLAGAAVAGAGGLVVWRRAAQMSAAQDALIQRSRRVLYDGYPDSGTVAAGYLRQAVRRRPAMRAPGACSPSHIATWPKVHRRKLSRARSRTVTRPPGARSISIRGRAMRWPRARRSSPISANSRQEKIA